MILFRLSLQGEAKHEISEWLKDRLDSDSYGYGDHDVTDLSSGYVSINGSKPVRVSKALSPAIWFLYDQDAAAFKHRWNKHIRCNLDPERLKRFPLEDFYEDDCPVVEFSFPAKH